MSKSVRFNFREHNVLLVILVCLFLTGCETPEETAARHLESAKEALADDDLTKARLEIRNALQINPKDADARLVLVDIAEQEEDYRKMWSNLLIVVDERPEDLDARIRLGTLALVGGAPAEAAAQAEAAMLIDPDNADVRLLYARVLIQENKITAAEREIDRALEIEPTHGRATLTKAQTLFVRDNAEEALALINRAIEGNNDPEMLRSLRQLRTTIYASSDQRENTENELKELIKDFPEIDTYKFQLAQYYLNLERTDDAEIVMREAAESNPDSKETALALVKFLQDYRDGKTAEAALEDYISKSDPEDAGVFQMIRADMLVREDRKEEAAKVYEDVANRSPLSKEGLEARNRLSLYYAELGDQARSDKILEEVLNDAPNNTIGLLTRAGKAYDDGRYDDAVSDIRVAIRENPESTLALEMLSRTHVAAGNALLAEDGYRRLLEIDPENASAKRQLASLLTAGGESEEAEELLRDALEGDPDDLESSGSLVQMLLGEGNIADAEKQAEELFARDDVDNAASMYLKGQILEKKGDRTAAMEAYQDAYEQAPNESLLLLLGGELKNTGRYNEAIELYEDFLIGNPESFIAKNNLASLWLTQQKDPELYSKAVDLLSEYENGSDSILLNTLGWAHLRADDPEKAISILTRSTEISPNSFDAQYHLGLAHIAAGSPQAARSPLEKAIQIAEGNGTSFADLDEVKATLADLPAKSANSDTAVNET